MLVGLLLSLYYRYVEEVPRDELSQYKPVPQNRSIHQTITTGQPCELILREYTCVHCSEGQYADCVNPQAGSDYSCVFKLTTLLAIGIDCTGS